MSVEGDLNSLPKDMREKIESSGAWRAWDVTALRYGARALAMGEDGVRVFGITQGATLAAPWSDVEELSFPTQFQMKLKIRGHDDPRLLTLKQVGHRREIVSYVPPSDRERLGVDEPPSSSVASSAPDDRSNLSSPGAAQLGSLETPVDILWRILWVGVGLQAAGGVFVWSSLKEFDEEGNYGGLVVGWLLSAVGGSVLFVALVGFGTMLGVRAARARG